MSNNNDSLYDPYVKRGAGESGNATKPGPSDRIQDEIQGAMDTMRNNINKISERGERLDHLQDKTEDLSTHAHDFRRGANRVRKQMWWKDMKMRICIVVGIIILLVVIIVPSVVASKH